MNDESRKLLLDIIFAAEEAKEFIQGIDFDSFCESPLIFRAVEREFEIIGEALNRLSRNDPDLFESIPDSHKIISFRNIIAHGYDIVDERIMWAALTQHLPAVSNTIRHLLTGK